MAKFIAIKSSAASFAGGDYLLGVEGIITVEAVSNSQTDVEYDGKKVAIAHGSTGTVASVRDAINAALTANPGGVKARVQLPAGITVTGITVS
jgi:hypothetical protein